MSLFIQTLILLSVMFLFIQTLIRLSVVSLFIVSDTSEWGVTVDKAPVLLCGVSLLIQLLYV